MGRYGEIWVDMACGRVGHGAGEGHRAGTGLAPGWHWAGTVLAPGWHRAGTVLAPGWHRAGTGLALGWHCAGLALAARLVSRAALRRLLGGQAYGGQAYGTSRGHVRGRVLAARRRVADSDPISPHISPYLPTSPHICTDEGTSLVEHARDEVGDVVVHRLEGDVGRYGREMCAR